MLHRKQFHTGDPVVFRVTKRSTHPGPRAQGVRPEPSGEGYHYHVDKFWTVVTVREGQLLVQTRRGKLHLVDPGDPDLRPAGWWERLAYRDRFPSLQSTPPAPMA
ncbi:MAG: hypothetical protein JWL69_816 [Phycisphaerales bacterium]|jgi:hypothetical protein|nr:hypothetical protein [Phycisphaerales bacterium]MDB5354570.1 hypothetical protein [Phycisphaerales bacterium]